jgi:glycosyltransferase involved in cell wall biosynthesis
VPNLLVEHDLTFSLYRQLASNGTAEAWREYERWRNFERDCLRRFHGVWTVCEEDRVAAIHESGRPAALTFAVPNGVDTERFLPRETDGAAPEILYVGSFRHLPNRLGFEALRKEVMSLLWSRHPHLRLRVVAGPRHQEFWNGEADSRITVHGFVEDLRPLYARATAVAVPLQISAGTNIKVLEAMACGKAIVSTVPGCAGLGLTDGLELSIREDWPSFAAALDNLLMDSHLRRGLGERARRTAEAQFSWNAIADGAWQSYLRLAGRAKTAQVA